MDEEDLIGEAVQVAHHGVEALAARVHGDQHVGRRRLIVPIDAWQADDVGAAGNGVFSPKAQPGHAPRAHGRGRVVEHFGSRVGDDDAAIGCEQEGAGGAVVDAVQLQDAVRCACQIPLVGNVTDSSVLESPLGRGGVA